MSRFKENLWVSEWIKFVFVDIGVQESKVIVIHCLVSLGLMIELDRVGAPTAESTTGVERSHNF